MCRVEYMSSKRLFIFGTSFRREYALFEIPSVTVILLWCSLAQTLIFRKPKRKDSVSESKRFFFLFVNTEERLRDNSWNGGAYR